MICTISSPGWLVQNAWVLITLLYCKQYLLGYSLQFNELLYFENSFGVVSEVALVIPLDLKLGNLVKEETSYSVLAGTAPAPG